MVPVWQKLQVSVQPTWVETHKAPRSSSGMKTRLDLLAVGEAQQPLAGAVARALLGHDVRPGDRVAARPSSRRRSAGSVVIASNEAAPRW